MVEIVLGPPGTGKTTTLINIVREELARGTPADRIGYVSFTRRASEEAGERATGSRDRATVREQFPHFRTLHSMCYWKLGLDKSDVLDLKKSKEFGEWAHCPVTGRISEDGTTTGFELGDRVLFMDNLARVRMIPLREQYNMDNDGLEWTVVEQASKAFRTFKADEGLMDYTDMLSEFVRSGIEVKLDVLLVDEGQDLSKLQWEVVRRLAQSCCRVVVAGDDDQAIYQWSGSDVETLINLQGDVTVLDQSYRVPPAIQAMAGGITRYMGRRREKHWRAREGTGLIRRAQFLYEVNMHWHSDEEGDGRDMWDILILARNTYIIRDQVEPILRRQGVIWERNGFLSVKPTLWTAIKDWESLRRGEVVPGSAARGIYEQMVVNQGVRYGFKSLPKMDPDEMVSITDLQERGGLMTTEPWFSAFSKVTDRDREYLRAALGRGERPERPRVHVSTIHGSKGGEARRVVIMKEVAARTWREVQERPHDEARVWYVAATRARQETVLVEATTSRACPWI